MFKILIVFSLFTVELAQETLFSYKNLPYSSKTQALSQSNLSGTDNHLLDIINNPSIPTTDSNTLGFYYSNYLYKTSLFHVNTNYFEFNGERILLGSFGLLSTGIERRDISSELIGEYSNHFLNFYLAYGRMITDRFRLGGNLSYNSIKLESFHSSYISFDLAIHYQLLSKVYASYILKNLSIGLNNEISDTNLKFQHNFGLNYSVEKINLLLYLALYGEQFAIGVDKKINKKISLLFSYSKRNRFKVNKTNNFQDNLSFGLGINFDLLNLVVSYSSNPYFNDQISFSLALSI